MSKLAKQGASLFYEVADSEGNTTYGGGSPAKAVEWFRQSPAGSRLFVTAWESDDLDAQPVGPALDLTELVGAVRGGWIW
jgi:hypothetical protein